MDVTTFTEKMKCQEAPPDCRVAFELYGFSSINNRSIDAQVHNPPLKLLLTEMSVSVISLSFLILLYNRHWDSRFYYKHEFQIFYP